MHRALQSGRRPCESRSELPAATQNKAPCVRRQHAIPFAVCPRAYAEDWWKWLARRAPLFAGEKLYNHSHLDWCPQMRGSASCTIQPESVGEMMTINPGHMPFGQDAGGPRRIMAPFSNTVPTDALLRRIDVQ